MPVTGELLEFLRAGYCQVRDGGRHLMMFWLCLPPRDQPEDADG
jgi:hypothetical protein